MSEPAAQIETVNVTFGAALRNSLRALVVSAYPADSLEATERRTDLLLPHASRGAAGDLRIDPAARLVAPKILIPLTPYDGSEVSMLKRASELEQRLEPMPRVTNPKAAIAALSKLPAHPTDLQRCARASEITKIWEAAGIRVEDPDGD